MLAAMNDCDFKSGHRANSVCSFLMESRHNLDTMDIGTIKLVPLFRGGFSQIPAKAQNVLFKLFCRINCDIANIQLILAALSVVM